MGDPNLIPAAHTAHRQILENTTPRLGYYAKHFGSADRGPTGGDDRLSKEEFMDYAERKTFMGMVLPPAEAERIFEKHDANGDGALSFPEFIGALDEIVEVADERVEYIDQIRPARGIKHFLLL